MPPSFTTKEARTPEEIQQSRDIRFAVFIDEQVRRLDTKGAGRGAPSHEHEHSSTAKRAKWALFPSLSTPCAPLVSPACTGRKAQECSET